MKSKIFILISILVFFLSPDIFAWGGRRSRGARMFRRARRSYKRRSSRTSSWWKRSHRKKKSYSTGSKSSRTNIHKKLARKSAKRIKTYKTKSEAIKAFKKSKEFKKLPVRFTQKPKIRPSYIPRKIHVYPVIFYNHSYGYWQGERFIPLNRNQYVVERSVIYRNRTTRYRRSSPFATFIGFILFTGIIFFIVFIIIKLLASSKKEESKKSIPKSNTLIPKSTNKLFGKLHSLKIGSIINLSDPTTLEYFDKPVDFIIEGNTIYQNEDFHLLDIQLKNYTDGKEDVELHLFVKEVENDIALFLGIIDHEGRNETLLNEDWIHLSENEDEFEKGFSGIFEIEEKETEILFEQYEYGAFYDMKYKVDEAPVGICEYYPTQAPENFEWQHVIVLWHGDWITCYYCKEIHEGNMVIF